MKAQNIFCGKRTVGFCTMDPPLPQHGAQWLPQHAPMGTGVPLQATMKASIDARLSWGRLAGAAAAPAPALPPSHPICMAAPGGAGAAGGGAAQRSRSPGAQTPSAASTSATWAAPASHLVVAFAPWRRQHAWNLHRHGAGSIDSESTLERILPKEFILTLYCAD